MKHIRKSILSLCLALTLGFSAQAYGLAPEDAIDDALKQEIADMVEAISAGDERLSGTLTAEDIDYSQAYQVYIDTDIFTAGYTPDEALPALDTQNSVIHIPIVDGETMLLVTLNKGLPVRDESREILTDEQITELESNVGKWILASVDIMDAGKDNRSLAAAAVSSADFVLVNDTKAPMMVFAVEVQDDQASVVVPLSSYVPDEDVAPASLDEQAAWVAGESYTFAEMQDQFSKLPEGGEGLMGGMVTAPLDEPTEENHGYAPYLIVTGIGIAGVAVAAVVIKIKKAK